MLEERLRKGFCQDADDLVLGGSWVVISGATSPPNMAYKYSYPNYNPIYNYAWTAK